MKTLMLLSLLLFGTLALAQDQGPPAYFISSNVQGVVEYNFGTVGPSYKVVAPSITCDCEAVTYEFDGKRWNKSTDYWSIPDLAPYVSPYYIGVPVVPGSGAVCSEVVSVTEAAYSKSILTQPNVLIDQGIGSRWEAVWTFQGLEYDRYDQWERYCDGSGPDNIARNIEYGPC